MDQSKEVVFQNDIIEEMTAKGWLLGESNRYDRTRALYVEDLLHFVKTTQPKEWDKLLLLYKTEEAATAQFLTLVVNQLEKADINATDIQSRTFGTLGLLRHGLRHRNARFSFCQFKPEHSMNPDLLANYEANRFRIVPELVYSPFTSEEALQNAGEKSKKHRIDLVLFVNGLPVITMELKSEFKQSVDNALRQYRQDRLPYHGKGKQPEPLLSFKRGALVHFAVSQYEVYMTTHLKGDETYFLPFNRGTKEGGAGNDVAENEDQYATDYLWNDVLLPENLLAILSQYMHLEIKVKTDVLGKHYREETMIFPRYHQWDVVRQLLAKAKTEGVGHKYLIQHSAGSGKSNSIAWTAHQLSKLFTSDGKRQFDSVIVITDRTVLDSQLQDTIYQFEHSEGVVARINDRDGVGSKSEKLAEALVAGTPIIIVTIQTFPFVLQHIENNESLKARNYAVIADEAHSSQTGRTASELKRVLMTDGEEGEKSTEDKLNETVEARLGSSHLNYYAFTATPKAKTIELFGTLPNPDLPASLDNKPAAFHVYSMRQAIEEGFILDVLKNYTNYQVVYQLKQKLEAIDHEVDEKRAKMKLGRWIRLHDHNISQKVKVIVEHFKEHVSHLLAGQAKAMVVTSSRKEAVRYKQAFDQYIKTQSYQNIEAMVAFSGEVIFDEDDPDSSHLIGETFTESNMNPGLKGREMRRAFDSDDYQVMIVANKFQTGFDQPKLCAMYVDKKLGGVECVQTLSRLNRTYPGKAESGTFILDFFNEPAEILEAFLPYYQTAMIEDVSDPDQIFTLFDKLRSSGLIIWSEVERYIEAFYSTKSNAAISNLCKPAIDRWRAQYGKALTDYRHYKLMFERTKKTQDPVLIANAENALNDAKKAKDTLNIFKKDLGSYVRMYDFLAQIFDYDDLDLEKLSIYARHLRPMLREEILEEDEIDLSNIEMSHYRVSKVREQHLILNPEEEVLIPNRGEVGTAKAREQKETFLSIIIARLNELFAGEEFEGLTDEDRLNCLYTILDKIAENENVVLQVKTNPKEHARLGDYASASYSAVIESQGAFNKQVMELLSNESKFESYSDILFDLLVAKINGQDIRTFHQ